MTKLLYFTLVLALSALLAACSNLASSAQIISQAVAEQPPSALNPTLGEPQLQATNTPLSPTTTPQPSPTSLPTITPSPTPTPPHPLTIEWLRQGDYPGSEIIIEQTLEPGSNYRRYIASYRSQGLRIFALLTIPEGAKPENGWPVIVFNHGYIPPDQYRTTERYVDYVDAFASRGYIVFRSDYRGHGFSEGLARGGYGNPDYSIDVLNAVASIKRIQDADPERIGMWGHSMGGYITLRSMVASDDIKAGVIWAGVVASYPDLISKWRRPGPAVTLSPSASGRRWRDSLSTMYGSPEENPAFWDSISANSYLGDLSGPVQLHHGTSDETVPLEFSATLYQQILNAGGVAEYYTYEGDNHNLSIHFSEAMYSSLRFFDTYLKPAQ